jgi:hypothetical protein
MKPKPTSARRETAVSREALSELAKITKVPSIKKKELYEDIRRTAREAWIFHYVFERNRANDWMHDLGRSLDKAERSFVRLTKAAKEFLGSIIEFADSTRDILNRNPARSVASEANLAAIKRHAAFFNIPLPASDEPAVPFPGESERALSLFDDETISHILYLAKIENARLENAQKQSDQDRRRRGRHQTFASGLLVVLIIRLLDSVTKAGGAITFNKNRETSGVRALRILLPFLPPLIPNVLPLEAMAAAYRKWKAEPNRGVKSKTVN